MRLSHRLTLVFSLFGVAIAGGLQLVQFREIRRESYTRAKDMAEVTSAAVLALVSDEAKTENLNHLGLHLEAVVREAGIAAIIIKDGDGRKLLGRYDSTMAMHRTPHPDLSVEQSNDGIYDVEKPVDLGPLGDGVVDIAFHTAALESHLLQMGVRSVALGVWAFLGIAFFAWLIGTWFGMRIERLVPRLEALPQDPETFRPLKASGGNDEVSRLVSAFNHMGTRLKSETLRRRELEREREELLAMLVHDLKTPLTVISSGVSLLEEEAGKSVKRVFQLLSMSTSRLRRMVEDVLQLSRLEAVGDFSEMSAVDMAVVVKSCAKDFGIIVTERKQHLALEVPKSVVPSVQGDPILLRRVLDNLLYNAVEHTPEGGKITLGLSSHNGQVRVSVSDSGPGVPLEARADIFRKFYRKDLKRHVGNVGLGLALCEKVVLKHSGAIGIEDAKPRGACFYFTLPAAKAS